MRAREIINSYYDDATPRQRDELDNLPTISSFHGMNFISVKGLIDTANSTYNDQEIARGIREVSIDDSYIDINKNLYSSAKEKSYIMRLADEIKNNEKIEPLILGLEPDGETWVIEGQHRIRALKQLGFNTFPAVIVVSMEGDRKHYEMPLKKREEIKTDYMTDLKQLKLFDLPKNESDNYNHKLVKIS